MLRPGKHSHPDQTTLAAATVLLKQLRRKRVVPYDELKAILDRSTRGGAEYLFTPAVSLLHLLDLLEYRPAADSFEYRGK